MNFIYTVDFNADEPIMLINKHIGYSADQGVGIMGDQFQSELLALDAMGKRRVKVYINSTGGSVLDAYSIYSTMLHTKCKVDTYCMGICASSAALIFEAGSVRYISDFGMLMIHNVGEVTGEVEKMFNRSVNVMIAQKTGKTESETFNMMQNETWFDSSDAIEHGFADKIVVSASMNRPRLTQTVNDWALASNYLNKIVNKTEHKMDLTKICNALELNPEASEGAVLKAINALSDKKDKELNETKNSLSLVTGAKNALDTKVEELEKAIDEKAVELVATKLELAKNKAETLVDAYVAKGAVKKESRGELVLQATNSFDTTEATLKAIPVIVKGVDLTKVANETKTFPTNAYSEMAEINKRLNK